MPTREPPVTRRAADVCVSLYVFVCVYVYMYWCGRALARSRAPTCSWPWERTYARCTIHYLAKVSMIQRSAIRRTHNGTSSGRSTRLSLCQERERDHRHPLTSRCERRVERRAASSAGRKVGGTAVCRRRYSESHPSLCFFSLCFSYLCFSSCRLCCALRYPFSIKKVAAAAAVAAAGQWDWWSMTVRSTWQRQWASCRSWIAASPGSRRPAQSRRSCPLSSPYCQASPLSICAPILTRAPILSSLSHPARQRKRMIRALSRYISQARGVTHCQR